MSYRTTLTCPVCDTVLDDIKHPEPELSGMATALLGGEHRRDHGEKSPECRRQPDWVKGWNSTTVSCEEEDTQE